MNPSFPQFGASAISRSVRESFAIGMCVVSASLGVVALNHNWATTGNIAIAVSSIWSFTASWLGRRFSHQEWRQLHQPVSEVFVDATRGKPAQDSPIVRFIGRGGTLLFLVSIVWLIRQVGPR